MCQVTGLLTTSCQNLWSNPMTGMSSTTSSGKLKDNCIVLLQCRRDNVHCTVWKIGNLFTFVHQINWVKTQLCSKHRIHLFNTLRTLFDVSWPPQLHLTLSVHKFCQVKMPSPHKCRKKKILNLNLMLLKIITFIPKFIISK